MHEKNTNDNLTYESSSASDDSNMIRRYQRRILESESEIPQRRNYLYPPLQRLPRNHHNTEDL